MTPPTPSDEDPPDQVGDLEPGDLEPDGENALAEDGSGGDVTLSGYSPPERPLAARGFGTTAEEGRRGEGLDARLARELPEPDPTDPDADTGDGIGDLVGGDGEPVDPLAGGARAGRLTLFDDGTSLGLRAHDVGPDDGSAAAEEAAMHVVDDPEADGRDTDDPDIGG
ncbi:DUF5709 domain-containing protein (plasmid) [Streptomyces sp. BI20]|uniref:DUF5709 domain-containing protein n=1 Tax=Streptomyces sp. BI20 TaxID=3403460 RepID=UPI003C759352